MTPEDILFTELDGTRSSVQEVIYSGLDLDYSQRYPQLLHLLRGGEPAHKLYACMILSAWDLPKGLAALTAWAQNPTSAPWAEHPVTYDRLFGSDAAFEMLAWTLWASGDTKHSVEIAALRRDAVRALLGLYHSVYFDRTLSLLLSEDRELAFSLHTEIHTAVRRAVEASLTPYSAFDLATQAAFLLADLARLSDNEAAQQAHALILAHPNHSRCLREVAYSLGDGSGPATHTLLIELADSPHALVREDAQTSLRRRALD